MASVNLKGGKCDKNKARYGIPKHLYRDGKNHANKDIDPSRSHLNKHYGPQTSAEFRERLKTMIAECDAKKPPKRRKEDRKVMLMADIPSPREGMSPEDEARWSAKTWEIMNELFPGQIVGATYHADEIHEYTDPDDHQQHMSRGHTHYGLIPWTESHGLNMDAFYKRDFPNRINEALDKACMEMFGIPYRDGSRKKSRGTVEQLKVESLTARKEQLQKSVGDLRRRETAAVNAVEALDNQLDDKGKQLAEMDKQIDAKGNQLKTIDKQIKDKQRKAEEISKPMERLQNAIQHLLKQLMELKPDQRKKEKDLFDWLEKHAPKMGKSLEEIAETTTALERESDRIEATYLSIEPDDDDYGLD